VSRSTATVDLSAIRHNAAALRAAAPDAELCAVVKANGYGHGEVAAAQAAIDGGATILAVARVIEGCRLRNAGLNLPIWVLSEPESKEFVDVVAFGLQPAVYSVRGIEAAAAAAYGSSTNLPVHLKIDTGMHRVGVAPGQVVDLARRISDEAGLDLGSVWTHLAMADEPDDSFTIEQLDRFEAALAALDAAGVDVPMTHAANSGAVHAWPRSHRDVVRCGISLYGLPPSPQLAGVLDLRPALRWTSSVSFVKRLAPGDRVSYGQRTEVTEPTTAATVPVGYADGYRRALWSAPPQVLIGGKKRRILGVVTMDQMVVDLGGDDVEVGDEVVLIGEQDGERVTADDLAHSLDTINYEITCGITDRVGRRYVNRRARS
jgi:alanine racemase